MYTILMYGGDIAGQQIIDDFRGRKTDQSTGNPLHTVGSILHIILSPPLGPSQARKDWAAKMTMPTFPWFPGEN